MKVVSFVAAVAISASGLIGLCVAEDWPGFRGSRGGSAPDQDLPTKLTQENLLWKVKMPGVGTSSPIVVGDKLYLTAYKGYGQTITKGFGAGGFGGAGFGGGDKGKGGFDKNKGGGFGGFGKPGPPDPEQKNLKLLLLCLDPANGTKVWEKEIAPKLPEVNFTGMFREHGYASSTPASDGQRLIAFFGKTGVFAFDLEGKQLWQANVGSETHMWGTASSPVIFQDVVIVNACIESKSLIGLNKKTGKEIWRAKSIGTCWASPALVETKDGKTEVVMSWPGKLVGYDPLTGKELWHCEGIGFGGGGFGGFGNYTSSTPVAKDGIVYAIGGGGGPMPAAALAVKAGGSGDVSKTHVIWRQKAGASIPSPVIVGDQLCWVDATVQCLSLADGKSVHKDRLYDARGEYVSAVAAGNKLFALTRFDGLFVLDAADKFTKLDHHEFTGDTSIFNASPAISNGRLYLRSNAYLYCIGKK